MRNNTRGRNALTDGDPRDGDGTGSQASGGIAGGLRLHAAQVKLSHRNDSPDARRLCKP